MNEMMERCKSELERCFAPAIDFKAPYAKVMSDMAVKAIFKVMREPTPEMISAGNKMTDWASGADDAWEVMIDEALNG